MGLSNYLTYSLQGDIITIKEERVAELKETLKTAELEAEANYHSQQQMKNQLSESYEEIRKPDGTVIKKHIKDVLNERHELQITQVKLSYEMKIKELESKLSENKLSSKSTKRALSVSYGYYFDGIPMYHMQYDMWGPFGVSVFTNTSEFGLGIGVRF